LGAKGVAPVLFSEVQRDALLAELDEIERSLRLAGEIERFEWSDYFLKLLPVCDWNHFFLTQLIAIEQKALKEL